MQTLEQIKNIAKSAFPLNFCASRFPFTYHHDYGRQFYPEYKDLSRSDIARRIEERLEDFDEYWYELVKWAILYLIHSYTDEFAIAMTGNKPFWDLMEDIRDFERFKKNWL